MVSGTAAAKTVIERCTVTSNELSGIEMAGFAGNLVHATVRDCSAIVTKIDGLQGVSGFAQYVNDSVIEKSFVKANASVTAGGQKKWIVGGLCGLVANSQILNTYAELGNFSSRNTPAGSSVGGFVGRVENSVIRDSFVRTTLLETVSGMSGTSQ